jgi:hypothetical protein
VTRKQQKQRHSEYIQWKKTRVKREPLTDAEWNERFQKYVDPDYYAPGDLVSGDLQSTLSGETYAVALWRDGRTLPKRPY